MKNWPSFFWDISVKLSPSTARKIEAIKILKVATCSKLKASRPLFINMNELPQITDNIISIIQCPNLLSTF